MSALDWLKQMPAAPTLRHSDGLVLVDLAGRSVVFPDEASARFFYEAYTDVPVLEDNVATLRGQIDEGLLNETLGRARQLQSDNERLLQRISNLEALLQTEAQARTKAARRATVLAVALRSTRK